MKKLLLAFLASSISINAYDILSIDRDKLFADSKEGQHFFKAQEKFKAQIEQKLREKEQKLKVESQAFQKQAGMLSARALRKKQADLAKKFRALERDRQEMQEDLKMSFESGMKDISDNQSKIVKRVFNDKKAKVLVDANTPGVLAVAADTDITNEVKKIVDENFTKDSLTKEKKA